MVDTVAEAINKQVVSVARTLRQSLQAKLRRPLLRRAGKNAALEPRRKKRIMKTDNKPTSNTKGESMIKIYALTALMFVLIVDAVLAGGQLVGLLQLPNRVLPYIGGALLGYVVVGTFVVTHICAKSMVNRKG